MYIFVKDARDVIITFGVILSLVAMQGAIRNCEVACNSSRMN